jgi:hypothetical protein
MTANEFSPGDVLRSPSGSYASIRNRVVKDPKWKVGGWRVERLNNGTGDGFGHTEFLADYIISSWRKVDLDVWQSAPLTGGLEERHVFDGRVIRRELRQPTTDEGSEVSASSVS